MRRVKIAALTLSVVGLVSFTTVGAAADQVSGQAPFPAAGVRTWGGAHDCGLIAPQIIEGAFYNPRRQVQDGIQVVADVAQFRTRNSACGNSVTARIQTKVCGFWGCTWRDISGATWTDRSLPANGQVTSPLITGKLRGGTNSYRLALDATTNKREAESQPRPGIIGIVRETETTYSNEIKLTAG
ncbi:hypothetical protein [Streptomyces sp. NPDC059215]|uniref:hypothetical protein n=1 Tax=Streptomyces sp. NPDC059215 TaxID=3346772 RepID=UPI0036AA22BF